MTILHIAAEGGKLGQGAADLLVWLTSTCTGHGGIVTECLKAAGALLENRDNRSFTPLMVACTHGHSDAVGVLIKAGAQVRCIDSEGTTALHLAALAGSTSCVQSLLRAGHPLVALDNAGWPPLLYADFGARKDCVLALLKPAPQQLMYLGILMRSGYQVELPMLASNDDEFSRVAFVGSTRSDEATRQVHLDYHCNRSWDQPRACLYTLSRKLACVQESYYRYINDLLRAQPSLLDKEFDFLLELKGLVDLDIKTAFARRSMEGTFYARCRATVVSACAYNSSFWESCSNAGPAVH